MNKAKNLQLANQPKNQIETWQSMFGDGVNFKQAGADDYDWSSTNNPELQKKMNAAVDKAINEYLEKIQSGEISFPDNLQFEMDKISDETRHGMVNSEQSFLGNKQGTNMWGDTDTTGLAGLNLASLGFDSGVAGTDNIQLAKVFNTKQDLQSIGAAKPSDFWDTLTDQGKA